MTRTKRAYTVSISLCCGALIHGLAVATDAYAGLLLASAAVIIVFGIKDD